MGGERTRGEAKAAPSILLESQRHLAAATWITRAPWQLATREIQENTSFAVFYHYPKLQSEHVHFLDGMEMLFFFFDVGGEPRKFEHLQASLYVHLKISKFQRNGV